VPLEDGLSIPGKVARRRERIQKLQAARAVLEQRERDPPHDISLGARSLLSLVPLDAQLVHKFVQRRSADSKFGRCRSYFP
jgi:hypothetical protein